MMDSLFKDSIVLWGGWLLMLVVWSVFTVRLAQRIGRLRTVRQLRSEQGASYTLSFVLTIPIYTLFCAMVVDATLLCVSKIGTVYGAWAGARSAAVWEAMQPELRDDRVDQAVVTALCPFVLPGDEVGSQAGQTPGTASQHAGHFIQLLEQYSESTVRREQVETRFRRVAARTDIDIEIPEHEPGGDVTVTVEYRAPFLTPGVGRLFDPDHTYPYEWPIRSSVTLTLEYPVSDDGTLGIDYESF